MSFEDKRSLCCHGVFNFWSHCNKFGIPFDSVWKFGSLWYDCPRPERLLFSCTPVPRDIKSSSDVHIKSDVASCGEGRDPVVKSDVASSLEASDLHTPVVKEDECIFGEVERGFCACCLARNCPFRKMGLETTSATPMPSTPRRNSKRIAAKLPANQIVIVSDKKITKKRGPFPSPPRCARKRSSGERRVKELKSKPLFLSEIVEPQPSQIVVGSEMRTQCNKTKIEH